MGTTTFPCMGLPLAAVSFRLVDLYLDIAEHVMQIVRFAAQRQMVEDVLIHQFDVGIAQTYGPIGVTVITTQIQSFTRQINRKLSRSQ